MRRQQIFRFSYKAVVASLYLLPLPLIVEVILRSSGINFSGWRVIGAWVLAISVFLHVFNRELSALRKYQHVGEGYKWRWLERLVPDFINRISARTAARFFNVLCFVFGIALILGFMG
jgi:hypothetical protein